MNPSIKKLEHIFEKLIKEKFTDFSRQEEEDFEFSIDYDCSARLDNLLENIGLTVCGMHYRQSEISIDFELDNDLTLEINNHIFREVTIHLQNDGNYEITINNSIIEMEWRTSLTNFYNLLGMENESPELIEKVVSDIEKQLVFKKLKSF